MTHTPGPWQIDPAYDHRVILLNDRNGNAVGELVYADTRNPADARLIAAAPDLLAALRQADAWVAMYHDEPGHDAASRCMTDVIRAAIARATG